MQLYLKVKSFHSYNFEELSQLLANNIAYLNMISNKNIERFASLPSCNSRFSLLRSPHVDKKSREQFEIKTYSKVVKLSLKFTNNFDKQKIKLFLNIFKNSSAG